METWGGSDGAVDTAETPWTFDQSGASSFISLLVKPCSQSSATAAAVHGDVACEQRRGQADENK